MNNPGEALTMVTLSHQELAVILAIRNSSAASAFKSMRFGSIYISFADYLPNSVKVEISDKCSGIAEQVTKAEREVGEGKIWK